MVICHSRPKHSYTRQCMALHFIGIRWSWKIYLLEQPAVEKFIGLLGPPRLAGCIGQHIQVASSHLPWEADFCRDRVLPTDRRGSAWAKRSLLLAAVLLCASQHSACFWFEPPSLKAGGAEEKALAGHPGVGAGYSLSRDQTPRLLRNLIESPLY